MREVSKFFQRRKDKPPLTKAPEKRELTSEGVVFKTESDNPPVKQKEEVKPLQQVVDRWRRGIYNSPLSDYEVTFDGVLGSSIPELVQGNNAVVVDLMAPSGTLADFFKNMPEDFKGEGIAFSLTDERTESEKERDQRLGIGQLAGDITTTEGRRSLEERLNGNKADLIMLRPYGGLDAFKKDPKDYPEVVQWVWDNLNNNGGNALLQTPGDLALEKWHSALEAEGVEAYADRVGNFGILRIVKKPDSPEELPGSD